MAEASQTTFSVTAMMREGREVVLRFIDFYRAAGAHHIYIYYDASLDELAGIDLADVTLTECSDAFWVNICGARPETLDGCLVQTYMCSAQRHTSDWLLIVDADEYLTGGSLPSMLARVPDAIEVIRIRNVEAVWGPGDDILRPFGCSYFRKPLSRRRSFVLSRVLYSKMHPLFTYGLVGHFKGKQFLRRGTKFTEISSHHTVRGDRHLGHWAHEVLPDAASIVVAHFDAVSFDRWSEKWRRRYSQEVPSDKMSPSRASQQPRVKRAVEAGSKASLRLFKKFYGLNYWQCALLFVFGALERHDIFGERLQAREAHIKLANPVQERLDENKVQG